MSLPLSILIRTLLLKQVLKTMCFLTFWGLHAFVWVWSQTLKKCDFQLHKCDIFFYVHLSVLKLEGVPSLCMFNCISEQPSLLPGRKQEMCLCAHMQGAWPQVMCVFLIFYKSAELIMFWPCSAADLQMSRACTVCLPMWASEILCWEKSLFY